MAACKRTVEVGRRVAYRGAWLGGWKDAPGCGVCVCVRPLQGGPGPWLPPREDKLLYKNNTFEERYP